MTRKPLPTAADKAKRTLLGIEIPRDELAFVLLKAGIGMKPPPGTTAKQALADIETFDPEMHASFYRQADAAVLYFHERINAAKQPN